MVLVLQSSLERRDQLLLLLDCHIEDAHRSDAQLPVRPELPLQLGPAAVGGAAEGSDQ